MSQPSHELKVVTFNTWLLELFGLDAASDISPRRQIMVNAFNEMEADVLALREVWPHKHRQFLVDNLSEKYPYCTYDSMPAEHSRRNPLATVASNSTASAGIISGLMIFSKYPIENASQEKDELGCITPAHTLKFSQNTPRWDEQAVHKGAIHIVIHHPTLGSIDVYNSHFDALDFDEEVVDYKEDSKTVSRLQANEFIDFVLYTQSHAHQVIAIDINQHFRTWNRNREESAVSQHYQHIVSNLNVIDTFMLANNYNPETLTGVYTVDTLNNVYTGAEENLGTRSFANIQDSFTEGIVSRPSTLLDYIWYIGDGLESAESNLIFTREVQLYADEFDLDDRRHLSDHYGVMSVLTLTNE